MAKSKTRKEHNLTTGELILLCDVTVSLIDRDIDMFRKFGITADYKDNFQQKKNDFLEMKMDEVYEQSQIVLTNLKNRLLEELKTSLREFLLIAELCYNRTGCDYFSFDKRKISQQSDADIIITAEEIIELAGRYFENISPYGITNIMIDNLKAKGIEYKDALVKRNVSITEREIATINRTKASNDLYKELSTIRNLGRKMWAETDYALSNDYFLT